MPFTLHPLVSELPSARRLLARNKGRKEVTVENYRTIFRAAENEPDDSNNS
jgi:hypothetical protein